MGTTNLFLNSSRVVQYSSTALKMSLMWLRNDKYALMLVVKRQFYHSTFHSGENPDLIKCSSVK